MSKDHTNSEEGWEPGSNEEILKNKLGITSHDELADKETALL